VNVEIQPARPDPAKRELVLTASDFERVRKLIHHRAGIALGAQKQEMVYSRLAKRVRERGCPSFRAYLALLDAGDEGEWEAFTNALTTNLTAFFREPHHFDMLATHARGWARTRKLRIWCAAASSGEEPYSIAMALAEAFTTFAPPVEIVATDVDTTVLAFGERGVYPEERLHKLGEERLRRHFVKGGQAAEGRYSVREELRALVRFRRLNLLDPGWPIAGPFDAIFCRNVLIYFDRATQRRIVERFIPLLHADGLLLLGHSEGLAHSTDLYAVAGRTAYRPLAAHERRSLAGS